MAWLNPAMVFAANGIRTNVVKAKLHNGDPGTDGLSNNTSAGVQTISWAAATNDGDFALASALNFTGGPANGACTWLSLWDSAVTTFCGKWALTGDTTFNSAGEYTISAINNDGSAS